MPLFGSWVSVVIELLWWCDVILTVLCSFGVPMLMFHIHELSLESMTAVWLMPVVPTVVCAASGGVVAPFLHPSHAVAVIVVSYMLWGINTGLAFMIMALYFHRLSFRGLPNAEVIVSAFLPLGPLGQGAYGIIELAKASKLVLWKQVQVPGMEQAGNTILAISVLVAIMMWGLGLWWLVHGVTSVLIRAIAGGLRFNMGFWGFIFPLGVYTAATIALAEILPSSFLSWLAVIFIILLVLLWLGVAAGTARGAINRELFNAPCLEKGPIQDPCYSTAVASRS